MKGGDMGKDEAHEKGEGSEKGKKDERDEKSGEDGGPSPVLVALIFALLMVALAIEILYMASINS